MTFLPGILDCPACVWDDFGATGLNPAFARAHRGRLDIAGTELVRRPLIRAWRQRGYHASLISIEGCRAGLASREYPPRDVCDAIRQEAANAITADELVYEADLVEALAQWHRAHPGKS